MSNIKLGVEVVSAHDLMPKDGQGSVNSFVELNFDHQRFRTVTKDKDLNPFWNEQFYFNISDPSLLPELSLEATVYHMNRDTNAKYFLGKIRIPGTTFVPFSDAVSYHYPLEKRHLLSRVRGELGLKVFLTSDPSIRASAPLPAVVDRAIGSPVSVHSNHSREEISNASLNPFQDSRTPQVQTFHSVPREQMRQQYYSTAPATEQPTMISENPMRPQPPQPLRMLSSSSMQPLDFQLKETSPSLGGGRVYGGRIWSGNNKSGGAFDLVEKMEFLYVRVVKARELPSKDATGSLDPYVEVRLGNFKGATKHFEKNQNPEWHHVFAFSRERVQSSTVEVVLKDKDFVKDDFVGLVRFDVNEIPSRVPPDSPLAPEWYRLEDKKGDKTRGELMLAVWFGTQADEAFSEATHSEAALASDAETLSNHLRAKVYHAPRLWYLRVNVIEAQDAIISDKSRIPSLLCKVRLGNQNVKTNAVQSRNANCLWNEEFLLVASEPFEDPLILSVEDRVAPNKEEVIGQCYIPLQNVQRRLDDKPVHSQWHDLRKPVLIDVDQLKETKFSSKIQARICLEGGYHVLDESTQYSSDLRPTAKQLWKQPIGLLELGILNANGLPPMKTRDSKGTCDAFCVAKYGQKWIRTRTILNDLNPRFNEQYTWDVHDHSTVLTVGVFDNCQLKKSDSPIPDQRIGKVRIRLSTLETGRVYTHSYPLLVLHNSGVKKMGELHLAIRFSSTSLVNTLFTYTKPHLPKMHYIKPIPIQLQDILKNTAVQVVAARLSRSEPPLRREVVEYMTDAHSHLFSMRKSKANFFRLMTVFSGVFAVSKWFSGVCAWNNPLTTVLVHILFTMLVCYPQLILPTIFLYTFLIGVWNYRFRPRHPPHMNTKISYAEAVNADELDEEFDIFPSTRSPEVVRMRYDRLRSVAGRIQTVVGDIATQGERLHLLLTWRDPRATMMFLLFCVGMATVLYVTPFQVVVLIGGLYVMRHPKLRNRMPSPLVNFFRRLPARTDTLL